MPRNGDGSSDNGPIEGNDVIHGNSGSVRLALITTSYLTSHHITTHALPTHHQTLQRANLTTPQAELQHTKTNVAPMPEIEKGEALEGMNASGGGDAPKAGHTGQGKGADSNKPAPVDQVAK